LHFYLNSNAFELNFLLYMKSKAYYNLNLFVMQTIIILKKKKKKKERESKRQIWTIESGNWILEIFKSIMVSILLELNNCCGHHITNWFWFSIQFFFLGNHCTQKVDRTLLRAIRVCGLTTIDSRALPSKLFCNIFLILYNTRDKKCNKHLQT
jgi:hypothetical protein